MGGKRDRARRANLQRLCDAGLTLFLAEGTAAVTIDQIVTAAGMAKGSFYRYATDKADLVAQIMAPVVVEVTAALDRCERALRAERARDVAAIYTQLASELSRVVAAHAPRVLFYLQEARAPASTSRSAIHALSTELTARTVALTEIARRRRLIRDVDPEVAALTVLGAVDALLLAFLRRQRVGARDIPTVIRELVTIVLAGIARPPDAPAGRA